MTENLKLADITEQDLVDRTMFKQEIEDWMVPEYEVEPRKRYPWSEERKNAHFRRMKDMWAVIQEHSWNPI